MSLMYGDADGASSLPHEPFCGTQEGGSCTCRADRICARCQQVCRYDGWDHVHPNGLGIGSCAVRANAEYGGAK